MCSQELTAATGEQAAKLAVVGQLVRYRETLRLGLAMWAAHLQEKRGAEQPQNMWVDAIRVLSHRFPNVEAVLATYRRASEREENERLPWSDWFLSELSPREAHWMPTQAELLFTAVRLATMLIGTEPPVLSPQPWIRWREDEVDGALRRLDEQAALWGVLVPVTGVDAGLTPPPGGSMESWYSRSTPYATCSNRRKAETEAYELAKLREDPLDVARVETFRRGILHATRDARLIRSLFQAQANVERLDAPVDGTPMVSRTWMPKSYFTPGSDVIGLDWVAGDLSRVTANAEIHALLAALTGSGRPMDGPLMETVKATIRELREHDRHPSLIVTPIGWDLRRALELPPRNAAVTHPLIPIARSKAFDGVIDDVPVIDFPHFPQGPALGPRPCRCRDDERMALRRGLRHQIRAPQL